ncbi:MAG: transketolase [Bacilli bacterium]|nr:transketolase [Bacilli bacterium]
MNEEDKNIVNTIKLLAVDMIDAAQSGHPGIVLGAAPIVYTLFKNHLNFNVNDPNWFNRDRFIMSPGHGSALLYATLFMAGYDIKLEDLVRFRQIDSKTPGHPEKNITPGVEYSTGVLGEGFAAAVGMAIAEKYLEGYISKYVDKQRIIDHKIYCLVSDGDLQEGLAYEAANIAGLYGLNNLIVLYDSNGITLDNPLSKSSCENFIKRFDSLGWNIDYVSDSNNITKIDQAIARAKRNKSKPTIIEFKTIIGQDSFNQGTNIVHGRPLSKDDIYSLHQIYGLNTSKFEVTKKYYENFQKIINKRVSGVISKWEDYANTFHLINSPEIQIFDKFVKENSISLVFDAKNFKIQASYDEDLRETNSKIMNIIADRTPFFIGGSADLSASCNTRLIKYSDFSKDNFSGRNILYGVREHVMGAITNGISTYNIKAFSSTFLTFSDFMKPSIRLAAMQNLSPVYIFTHDSVNIGEDGPSHQPIEQLMTLRNVPNLYVYRPADINEVIGCWDVIMKKDKPSSLVISRTKVHILAGTNGEEVSKGGYIVKKENKKIDAILVSTGSDLTTTLLIADDLKQQYDLRVVSMPCQELFFEQSEEYQNEVLPMDSKIIAIEASTKENWAKITSYNNIIGLDNYGYSGKSNDVLKKMNFDKDSIKNKVLDILK